MDRHNVHVMVRFVSEAQHLMQMMMLLKDQSRTIQFEAFHVFKVRDRSLPLMSSSPTPEPCPAPPPERLLAEGESSGCASSSRTHLVCIAWHRCLSPTRTSRRR
jgi:hypothetical protein